jgi:hypothetical protein
MALSAPKVSALWANASKPLFVLASAVILIKLLKSMVLLALEVSALMGVARHSLLASVLVVKVIRPRLMVLPAPKVNACLVCVSTKLNVALLATVAIFQGSFSVLKVSLAPTILVLLRLNALALLNSALNLLTLRLMALLALLVSA